MADSFQAFCETCAQVRTHREIELFYVDGVHFGRYVKGRCSSCQKYVNRMRPPDAEGKRHLAEIRAQREEEP